MLLVSRRLFSFLLTFEARDRLAQRGAAQLTCCIGNGKGTPTSAAFPGKEPLRIFTVSQGLVGLTGACIGDRCVTRPKSPDSLPREPAEERGGNHARREDFALMAGPAGGA